VAPYIRMSVCLCVCHKSEFYRNGWTDRQWRSQDSEISFSSDFGNSHPVRDRHVPPPRGCATADRALFTTQAALGLSYVSSTASRGTIAGKTERTDSVVGHLASELDPISDHFFAAVFSRRFHLQDDHIRRSLLDPNHRLLLRNRCR